MPHTRANRSMSWDTSLNNRSSQWRLVRVSFPHVHLATTRSASPWGRKDYITTADGKQVVDHEHIARAPLRVDSRKWMASKLAPKKYGGHIRPDVQGPGPNFQPAICITVNGRPPAEY